ncbi:hypothetical protein HanPI659440_Chr08g0290031 [Helianthus annuus]|nr:hypothetical protein HanPI659440_Chr08g0290031 [Helianthus annuus]
MLRDPYAARLNLRNQRNPVTPSYGPREWLGWVYAARLNLLFLVFNLYIVFRAWFSHTGCILGSVGCQKNIRESCYILGTTPGLFNKIYSALTLSIVTQFHFIPTSRDRTPTNLGRALIYVTGPYVSRTGHQ